MGFPVSDSFHHVRPGLKFSPGPPGGRTAWDRALDVGSYAAKGTFLGSQVAFSISVL